jgi:hypothetical protein
MTRFTQSEIDEVLNQVFRFNDEAPGAFEVRQLAGNSKGWWQAFYGTSPLCKNECASGSTPAEAIRAARAAWEAAAPKRVAAKLTK